MSLRFFVWLDETGSDCCNHVHKFGYSLRGVTPAYWMHLARGHLISSVAAITWRYLVLWMVIGFWILSEASFFFVCSLSQPPNSIVIMAIYHVQSVKQESAGIMVFFLPPYSPDYNLCLATSSTTYRIMMKSFKQSMIWRTSWKSAFERVTASHSNKWIAHSGYGLEYALTCTIYTELKPYYVTQNSIVCLHILLL